MSFERSPEREVDDDRHADAERADHDEDGERELLLDAVDAGLGDRGRGADGQQQVLRVHGGEQDRRSRTPSPA